MALSRVSLPAATVTWTNTSGGNWSASANWSPNHAPSTGDTAAISTPGSYTIKVDINVTNGALLLGASSGMQTLTNTAETMIFTGGATIAANGVLGLGGGSFAGPTTIQGSFDWAGGTIYSNFNVSASGKFNISPTTASFFSALTNAGTVNWTGGNIQFNNNHGIYTGSFYNQPGALLNIQCDQSFSSAGYGFEQFNNSGIVQKNASTGSTTFEIPFTNASSATIDAEHGTISFNNVGNLAGNYNAASSATVSFSGGTYSQNGPVTVTGLGLCEQGGATITYTNRIIKFVLASGNVQLSPNFQAGSIQDLQISGAYLLGTNRVTGFLGFSGGGVGSASPLNIAPGAIVDFNGGAVNILAPVTNQGTINWTGGTVEVNNSHTAYTGIIVNQPSGIFSIQCDQTLVSGGYGYEQFRNLGLFQKLAGDGATTVSMPFTNSGTVDCESGVIRFVANGNIGGSYVVASNADIEFDSGYYTQSGSPTVSSDGIFKLNGATVTLSDQIPGLTFSNGYVMLSPTFQTNGSIHDLEIDGAFLLGTNRITGTLTFTGGGVYTSSPLTVAPGATLNVAGTINIDAPLTNQGTVSWTSGTIEINDNHASLTGVVYNEPDASWDAQCDQSLVSAGYGYEAFYNQGSFSKSVGLSGTSVSVPFTNSGTVTDLVGPIRFVGAGNLGGDYVTGAGSSIEFDSGNFTQSGSMNISGSGICQQSGANVTLFNAIPNFHLNSGNLFLTPTFEGSGTIQSLLISGATLMGTNRVTGTLEFTGGVLAPTAPLTVANGATVNFAGPGSVSIDAPFTNFGRVNWTGGTIVINDNLTSLTGVFDNDGVGFVNIESDQSMASGGYGSESFHNAGLVQKNSGIATTVLGVPFYNTGTVDVQSGTAQFSSAFFQTGGDLNFGINSLASFGHITFNNTVGLDGILSANFNGSYFPNAGDSFNLINYPSAVGTFASTELPAGVSWLTNYGATVFTLGVGAAPTYGIRIVQVPGYTVGPGALITVTNVAYDYDPANKITFGLTTAPTGATINSSTGVLQWQAPGTAVSSSNYFTVNASDNGSPVASASMSFTIVVNAPKSLDLTFVSLVGGTATMQINGATGTTNALQASTNLINWTSLSTNKPTTSPFNVLDSNAGKFPSRFYRLIQMP